MVRYCVMCGKREKGISYHKFPRSRHERAKWLTFCGMAEHDVSTATCLCSDHFSMWNLVNRSGKVTLKPGAIPTIKGKGKMNNLPRKRLNMSTVNQTPQCAVANMKANQNIHSVVGPPSNFCAATETGTLQSTCPIVNQDLPLEVRMKLQQNQKSLPLKGIFLRAPGPNKGKSVDPTGKKLQPKIVQQASKVTTVKFRPLPFGKSSFAEATTVEQQIPKGIVVKSQPNQPVKYVYFREPASFSGNNVSLISQSSNLVFPLSNMKSKLSEGATNPNLIFKDTPIAIAHPRSHSIDSIEEIHEMPSIVTESQSSQDVESAVISRATSEPRAHSNVCNETKLETSPKAASESRLYTNLTAECVESSQDMGDIANEEILSETVLEPQKNESNKSVKYVIVNASASTPGAPNSVIGKDSKLVIPLKTVHLTLPERVSPELVIHETPTRIVVEPQQNQSNQPVKYVFFSTSNPTPGKTLAIPPNITITQLTPTESVRGSDLELSDEAQSKFSEATIFASLPNTNMSVKMTRGVNESHNQYESWEDDSGSEEGEQPPVANRKPRYVGDIQTWHLANPRRAKKALEIAREALFKAKKTIKVLQQSSRRLTARNKVMDDMLKEMKNDKTRLIVQNEELTRTIKRLKNKRRNAMRKREKIDNRHQSEE